MRTTDITVLVPPKSAAPTPQQMATRGTVTIPPASLTDDTVTVVLPSYSADYGWPCRWVRQGNTLPAIGAECLVLWDETGAGTVVRWAGAGVALPTVADITALDARLDTLEASSVPYLPGTTQYKQQVFTAVFTAATSGFNSFSFSLPAAFPTSFLGAHASVKAASVGGVITISHIVPATTSTGSAFINNPSTQNLTVLFTAYGN